MWFFCLLLCDVLSLTNLRTNHFSTLLLNFSTIAYLVLHEILLRAWGPINFHLIISFLSAVSYYNITSCTSPQITLVLTFVYYLLSAKQNFVFTFRNSGLAITLPTGPSATAQPAGSEAVCFLKRLAGGLSSHWDRSYPEVLYWIQTRLAFIILRATGLYEQGSHSKQRCLGLEDGAAIDNLT